MAKLKNKYATTLVLSLLISFALPFARVYAAQKPTKIHVEGTNAQIIGDYGNMTVGGNMRYDGSGVNETRGFISIDVNDEANTGLVFAQWDATNYYNRTGTFQVVWPMFVGMVDFHDGGIATNLTLHGASEREAPIMPEVFNYVAGWGMADVYLNGTKIMPSMLAHFMVTDGTRDPITHAIYNDTTKTAFYNPMDPANGLTFPNDIVTHLIIMSNVTDPNNFPPFTVFMHVNFETITSFTFGLAEQIASAESDLGNKIITVANDLQNTNGTLTGQINTQTDQIDTLTGQINTLTNVAYIAIPIGIIGIIAGLAGIALARRKT